MSGANGMMTAMTAVQGMSQVVSGFSSFSASRREAMYMDRQGQIIEREAYMDAAAKAREVGKFQSRQIHQISSSGITVGTEGYENSTPIQLLEETRRLGQEEVDAIVRRGQAQKELMTMRAKMQRNAGRSALFGSLIKAAGIGLEGAVMQKRLSSTKDTGSAIIAPDYNGLGYDPSSWYKPSTE